MYSLKRKYFIFLLFPKLNDWRCTSFCQWVCARNDIIRNRVVVVRRNVVRTIMRSEIDANFISIRLWRVPICMWRIWPYAVMRKGGLRLQKNIATVRRLRSGVHMSRWGDWVAWSKGGDEDRHIAKGEIPRRSFNATHPNAIQPCGVMMRYNLWLYYTGRMLQQNYFQNAVHSRGKWLHCVAVLFASHFNYKSIQSVIFKTCKL